MEDYTAGDFINFIEMGRFDKVSKSGLVRIAEEYRRLKEIEERYKLFKLKI
jgi:hypothetical protein